MSLNDYEVEDSDTSEQKKRVLSSIVAAWDRRLLSLARANPDMSPAEISKLFQQLGTTLAFAQDMEQQKQVILRILAQQLLFEEMEIIPLLKFLQHEQRLKESKRRRIYGGVWAVFLVVIGCFGTAFVEYLVKGK